MRPLSLPERRLTSVPANSGTLYVPFFSKGHAEIFREFWHDFAKKGTYGVLRQMHGPGYLSSKLSGLFLYLLY